MPSFTNLQSLFLYIESQCIIPALKNVGEEIKNILRDYMQSEWYDAHSPSLYQRTYEILNSITVSDVQAVAGGYQVKVFFDDSKISPMQSTFDIPDELPRFNHHMSMNGDTSYGGISIGQWVAIWMNEGQGSPIHSYAGSSYFDKALAYITANDIHVKEIEKLLATKGITIG